MRAAAPSRLHPVVGWPVWRPSAAAAAAHALLPSSPLSPITPFLHNSQVYECAADVCTRAGDFPEALKALQTLVNAIYPALAAAQAAEATLANGSGGPRSAGEQRQEQRQQRAAASAPVAWADDECEEEGDEAWLGGPAAPLDDAVVVAALRQHRFRRWPEAAGALALYFDCCSPPAGAAAQQSGRGLDTLATLRRLPPRLLASPEVRAALRLRAALAAGDYVSLFRLAAAAPPLTAALVARGAATRERERALRVLAVAYRNIAVSAVCGVLALHAPRQLLACLKLLADRCARSVVWEGSPTAAPASAVVCPCMPPTRCYFPCLNPFCPGRRGHVAAQRALGGLQQEDAAALATADLVFKG